MYSTIFCPEPGGYGGYGGYGPGGTGLKPSKTGIYCFLMSITHLYDLNMTEIYIF